jgi:glycosyltransferase involved in cell wall biosynthesis
MSVYNGERYLRESVDGILGQSFRDLEFVIVDDGSTDSTSSLLLECEASDSRVHVIRQQHAGMVAGLIAGCSRARGRLLARIDADDVALPTRFEQQVAFLEAHPEVGVLGTRVEVIDGEGRVLRTSNPVRHHAFAAWKLLLWPSVAHPSVMMRRALLQDCGGYDAAFEYAEDYELWTRLVEVTRFANLPEALTRYRVHDGMTTRRERRAMLEATHRIRRRFLARLLDRDPSEEQCEWLERFESGSGQLDERRRETAVDLLFELHAALLERGILRRDEAGEVRADLERRVAEARCRTAGRGLSLPRRLRRWAAGLFGST